MTIRAVVCGLQSNLIYTLPRSLSGKSTLCIMLPTEWKLMACIRMLLHQQLDGKSH